jgi:hypothetical protein
LAASEKLLRNRGSRVDYPGHAQWTFPADIEVEYKIPKGSSAVAEVAKCVRYCKEALA